MQVGFGSGVFVEALSEKEVELFEDLLLFGKIFLVLAVSKLYVVLGGELFDRFGVGELLVLHHELYAVSPDPASETFVDLFGGADDE